MRRIVFALVGVGALAGAVATTAPVSGQSDGEAAPIYGIKLPQGYRDWHLISVKRLTGKQLTGAGGNLKQLRAELGNDLTIKAYRDGTLPFPDGAIIAALHWNDPAAGDLPTSRTANRAMRRYTKSASPATSLGKIATTFSLATHQRPELTHADSWRDQFFDAARMTVDAAKERAQPQRLLSAHPRHWHPRRLGPLFHPERSFVVPSQPAGHAPSADSGRRCSCGFAAGKRKTMPRERRAADLVALV